MKPTIMLKTVLALILINSIQLSHANTFIVTDKWLETQDYYDSCQDKCPEIGYQLIDTGHAWLDAIINKAVVMSLATYEEDASPNAKRWQAFQALPNPTSDQLTAQLNVAIKAIVSANQAFNQETTMNLAFSLTARPTYLGHKTLKNGTDLELFVIDSEQYLGGAHGMHGSTYYIFDMTKQRQLTLADIVIAKQKPALEKLLKAQYHAYLRHNDMNPDEMGDMWHFFVTDNVTLTKDGLTFLYQPYEITPYVMGSPTFTVPYAQLTTILKAEYLP